MAEMLLEFEIKKNLETGFFYPFRSWFPSFEYAHENRLNYIKVVLIKFFLITFIFHYFNPVKIDVNNDNEYSTVNNFIRTAQIKIRQNVVRDTASYMPLASSSQITYFSIGESTKDLVYNLNDNIIFQLYIVMDSKYNKINSTLVNIKTFILC